MDNGLRWMEFNKKDQLVEKQKFFNSEKARAKFMEKVSDKDNFHSFVALWA